MLLDRAVATLVASWAQFATWSPGARVVELPGASVAVFTHPPDREIFNNAVLAADAPDVPASVAAIERTYAQAGVRRFAVWVHATRPETARALVAGGYVPDESTRVMAMGLDQLREPASPRLELGDPDFAEFLRINDLPADLFPGRGDGVHVHLARRDGENVAVAMAFDHDGDCGIYNVATVAHARRQGLAAALTAHALRAARARGCTTASLQATPMAERVYGSLGFRDLGCFHEHVPGAEAGAGHGAIVDRSGA